jgi:hypothetical protein
VGINDIKFRSIVGNVLKGIVTDLLKAFLGNGSIDTFELVTVENVSQWTNIIARC